MNRKKKSKKTVKKTYHSSLEERKMHEWERLNRKIKRDNFIFWGLIVFVFIYLFFQI